MLSTALKFLSVALLSSRAAAQTIEPFVLDGRLDSATASDGTYNSGGTISVNGYSITIPQNLQVQFPAAFAPFGDFASAGSFVGHEVSVSSSFLFETRNEDADSVAQGDWKRSQWQSNCRSCTDRRIPFAVQLWHSGKHRLCRWYHEDQRWPDHQDQRPEWCILRGLHQISSLHCRR